MRALLDSHVFLWIVNEPHRIPNSVRRKLLVAESVQISIVSEWELLLKQQAGKLRLSMSVSDLLDSEIANSGLHLLPLLRTHLKRYAGLPLHHRDPFDRLLVAQALEEQLTVVTHDRMLARYGAKVLQIS